MQFKWTNPFGDVTQMLRQLWKLALIASVYGNTKMTEPGFIQDHLEKLIKDKISPLVAELVPLYQASVKVDRTKATKLDDIGIMHYVAQSYAEAMHNYQTQATNTITVIDESKGRQIEVVVDRVVILWYHFALFNVEQKNEDQMATGITTMIFVSCLSSMAGVYNEKLVKGTKANVW